MISFGELRRKALEWHTEISAVEKLYARDRLLKGIFDRPALSEALMLRGASALGSAYFADYPRVEDVDLGRMPSQEVAAGEMEAALRDAEGASGLKFKLHSYKPTEARVEFTGPLGRRSAAQPLLVVRVVPVAPRRETESRPLLHPFSDECAATVRAVSLAELAAERIVAYAQKPRARDVYDLWFILTRGQGSTDSKQVGALAHEIAREKKVTLRGSLDAGYAPLLERSWERALAGLEPRPAFAHARAEIERALGAVLGASV
jgi:predicted nucleotidyltransferase component of viral defense system